MKPKISLITLGVSDLARSLAFYRDGLDFPPHNYSEGDDCIMFRLDGTWLALPDGFLWEVAFNPYTDLT